MSQPHQFPLDQPVPFAEQDQAGAGSGRVPNTPAWGAIAEGSPLPIASVHGTKHSIGYANPAFCRLLCKTRQELTGKPFCEILPEADVCSLLLERVYSTGEPETYTEQGNPDHPALFQSLMMWPIDPSNEKAHGVVQERPSGIAIVVTETRDFHQQASAINQQLLLTAMRQHELTETAYRASIQENKRRLRAEEAARQSEARFRALANAAPNMAWSADASGKIDLLNDWWYRFTGLTPAQSLGERGFLNALHPDDRQRAFMAWAEAVKTGRTYEIEYRMRRASDGAYRWHLARGIPIRQTEGGPRRWFGTCTDIEDLKHVHEGLIRSEKLAYAGRMAASIAHEINNPLECVMNTLYLAQTSAELPEVTRAYLKMAEDELMRVSHIARQSLGFYRESSAPASVSISALLDSTLNLLQSRLKAKQVNVKKEYEQEFEVRGIAGELRQVFANLLVNSLDALPERGTVRLKTSLSSKSSNGSRHIRVTIADSGHGIDPSLRRRIFEPFFTTKGEIGTGLGLWVSKQLIDKHGGSIRVRSSTKEPHSGTVFSVVLPTTDVSLETKVC